MQRHLYYVRIKSIRRDVMQKVIVAAYNENNARAITEEYFDNIATEVRLCTLDDIKKVEDKRIMHASHIMTPLDMEVAERYNVTK